MAKSEEYKPFSHWGVPAASVEKLKKILHKAGEGARMEVSLVTGAQLYFKVVPRKGVVLDEDGENDTYHCPPVCP